MHLISRYEVVAVSEEFLALLRDMPEASSASYIEIGGRRIEGSKCVLLVNSQEEVERNLPTIIAQLADPKRYRLRVIHRKGQCDYCEDHQNEVLADCPNIHLATTLNSSWNVDVPKYLSPLRAN